jgi:ligand-binding sensor domain-containing protein
MPQLADLQAAEPTIIEPKPLELESAPLDNGWQQWQGIGNVEGSISYRERATALAVDLQGNVWVGTSHGRLLSHTDGKWTLQAAFKQDYGLQITGIAFQNELVWLSTSDGIRRLKRDEANWQLTEFPIYYEGHPSFVSGSYLPGEDAHRQWGFVDDLFVPRKHESYAPHVISTEHGLFSCSRGSVWHHFWPHYWGANSAWQDLRELIPHRRPTCMIEDESGNWWIGTEGDGIIRINARSLEYSKREPENNAEDDTAFTHISSKDVGCEFRRVNSLSAGLDGHVWAALVGPEKQHYVARFDGNEWQTVELHRLTRTTTQRGKVIKKVWWEPIPLSVFEAEPGKVLVGVEQDRSRTGALLLDWDKQTFEKAVPFEVPIRKWVKAPTGELWALSWWGVFEQVKEPNKVSTVQVEQSSKVKP